MEFFYLPSGQSMYDIGWDVFERVDFINKTLGSPKTWKEVLNLKITGPTNIPIFISSPGRDNYINLFTHSNATFLPDFIAAPLQILGHFNLPEDSIKLSSVQFIIVFILGCYERLLAISYFYNYFLIVNPYELPWNLITALTEDFLCLLQGILPVFAGVDLGSSIMYGLLAEFISYLKKLVFTMPYLASEKTIVNLKPFFLEYSENPPMDNLVAFFGIPKLWQSLGIPNELREKWYQEEPWVTGYLLDKFQNTNIEVLPDRLVNDLSNGSISLENSSTLSLNFLNFQTISESTFLALNHVFQGDILTNKILTIFEPLIHKF